MADLDQDVRHMARALELAARGQGLVEPNPMVGCVIVAGDRVIGEGWHRRYGGPHAEPDALQAAGPAAAGATMYVTLEPCCHQGKTPPCTEAIVRSGVARVVIAHRDPFPQVAGGGIARLQQAGLAVAAGVMEAEARWLNAPYLKLVCSGRPWVIAKWAMTLDGKIASRGGDSRWISGAASRRCVHQLRGRMDAILVSGRTARVDRAQLTVRPPGQRTPLRIVVDSQANLPLDYELVRTARQTPVLIAAGPQARHEDLRCLEAAGCQLWVSESTDRDQRLLDLLDELGRRRLTNILVEGGGQLLGSLFDAAAIDEVHAFVAAKMIGGAAAPSPLGGIGRDRMAQAVLLQRPEIELLEGDVYLHGRIAHVSQASTAAELNLNE